MRTRVVDIGSTPITLREWGNGHRTVLALHAMGPVSTGALYGCAVAPLLAAGFQVVAPNLPGYGRTPGLASGEYDVGRLAALIWRLVENWARTGSL